MEGGGLSMAPAWIRTCQYLWIKDNFCKELHYPPIAVEQCLKKYTVKHCWLTYFHGIILTDYSAGMRMDVLDNMANHKKHVWKPFFFQAFNPKKWQTKQNTFLYQYLYQQQTPFDKFNENYIKLPEKIFTSINVHFVIHWERGHMKNTDFGNAVTTTVILHKHKL